MHRQAFNEQPKPWSRKFLRHLSRVFSFGGVVRLTWAMPTANTVTCCWLSTDSCLSCRHVDFCEIEYEIARFPPTLKVFEATNNSFALIGAINAPLEVLYVQFKPLVLWPCRHCDFRFPLSFCYFSSNPFCELKLIILGTFQTIPILGWACRPNSPWMI